MSCFVVSDYHVSALVAWAAVNGADLDASPHALAHELASANRAAFNERYAGRYQDEVAPFVFTRLIDLADLAPVAIVKACDCLAYQCSDWTAWDRSDLARDLGEIRAVAVQLARGPWSPGEPDDPSELPGYHAAAWCLDEPDTWAPDLVAAGHAAADLAATARALVHTLQSMAVHPSHYADLVAALAAVDATAERDRRLAELDYPEHEIEAIRAALAATRCAA